jgi:hypothetical protein
MISETLDSILKALEHTTLPVKFKICLNAQTYLSKPLQGTSEEMFKYFLDHPFFKLKDVEIVKKTDSEPFYNIGDWRREIYDKKAKYTIWGEPDTLVPQDYFYILEKYNNPSPHVLSLSCRKMWDNTWKPLELKSIRNNSNPPQELLQETYINLDQLNKINQSQGDVEIEKISNIEYLSRYMGGNERLDLYSLFQDIAGKFDNPIEKMIRIMKINFSIVGKNMADRGHKQWETLLLRLNLDKDVEQQWGRALNKL